MNGTAAKDSYIGNDHPGFSYFTTFYHCFKRNTGKFLNIEIIIGQKSKTELYTYKTSEKRNPMLFKNKYFETTDVTEQWALSAKKKCLIRRFNDTKLAFYFHPFL